MYTNNMAENLNKPGDFVSVKSKGMDLLPPSAFESKTKPNDPWKELSRAAEEMMKLKQENTQLREAQKIGVSPSQVPKKPSVQAAPEVCQYKSRHEDLRYVDELINKQANEITDLKNELRLLKCNQREELTDMERQLTTKEREFVHNIAALETELKAAENRYDAQVDRLSREHQKETEELTAAVEKLTDELTTVRQHAGLRVEELEAESACYKQQLTESVQRLQVEIRSKENVLENQKKQIEQLKKYIGESENIPQPVDIARKEIESLNSKLKASDHERENLQSTITLLNIRLNSVTEILKLQETEIGKSSLEIERSKQESLLLTRWREKVFALMVQQKSADISSKKDQQNWRNKSCDLERKLSSALNQVDQLSHTLADRTAQLDLERNNNTQLQKEVSEAQQLALCLDDNMKHNLEHATTLHNISNSVSSKFEENIGVLSSVLSTLKSYGQRISFASGRVEMIEGLLARREAMSKLNNEEPEKVSKETLGDLPNDREEDNYLRAELESVVRDRNQLTAQIKQDTKVWEDKIHTMRTQYEEDLANMSQKVQDLEHIVQEKSQSCQQLSEKLEDCQREMDEASDTIEELKTTIAKQEMNMDKLFEDQRKSIEEKYSEQFAEMDRKLNDAKREHVKAVVSLRQLERQSSREKERGEEHLKTTEEHYLRQINKLQEQLQATEAERNLMMATLRQEGLIGKLKRERREPIPLDSDTDQQPVREKVESASPREATDLKPAPTAEEPLTSVLQDLEYLTSAVLKDDSSDSGSDINT